MDIEAIRAYCLKLPHTAEDIKWEQHLCFTIGAKMFCITDLQDPYRICVKVTPEDFHHFTQFEHIIQAPYFAKTQWILIKNTALMDKKELKRLLKNSYLLVRSKLPKKMQLSLS